MKIAHIANFDGQNVTLRGWVTHRRSSGKVQFLNIRDGSGTIQVVVALGTCKAFEDAEKLTQESSVIIEGTVKKEPRSPAGYEIIATSLQIQQVAEPYPITPKEHGIEFLMEHRHLWMRSPKSWAILRIRAQIIRSVSAFFDERDFVRFDAPILTPSACEGTSTLFETPYFDTKAYLTQSGQLYGEAGAMAFGRVYVAGPTFRAEKSKTRKHLTEFWMIEPEVAWATLDDMMDLGEALIEHIKKDALEHCARELALLERDLSKLAPTTYERITYDEALAILQKKGHDLVFGDDLGAPQETALGEHFGKPVFMHHMPAAMKAFYFKHDGKYALGCDLIAPDGYGEIIGGGQREESVETLQARFKEHGLQEKDYNWYLDLRRYGSVPHSGFGMGLERVVAWISGAEHVRQCVPFPRLMNTLHP